jgi:uncharacterized repeat protein (TIGR01451 family)
MNIQNKFLYLLKFHHNWKRLRQRLISILLGIFCVLFPYFLPINQQNYTALAQVNIPCATPGKDGVGTVNTIVNSYFQAVSGTINAGAASITIGSKQPVTTPDISIGDLLLIIQMQDADFNASNTDAYGDNTSGDIPAFPTSQPSNGASGWTNLNNTGRYEFVTVTNVSGSTISIRGTGTNNGLKYTYSRAAFNGTNGQKTYQIIRVPQYSSVTLAGATTLPWNGSIGGVFVIDVAGQLTLGGGVVVEASGTGFRGGAGRQLSGVSGLSDKDFRTLATQATNGSKGEGIAGTPRYVLNYFDPLSVNAAGNPTSPVMTDTGVEGYPNGSYARGAPGNAGGGSTDGDPSTNAQNSGGGGGSNGGGGGRGGRAWSSQEPTGGFGGKAFSLTEINNGDRLFLGGGGGAGTTNNSTRSTSRARSTNYSGTMDFASGSPNQDTAGSGIYSSGAAGGGLVMIRTNTIAGTGTIRSRGANGLSSGQDGAGGGGAGGTVYVVATDTTNISNITADVGGGEGGWSTFRAAHGPGGGGGGGVVISSIPGVTIAPGGLDGGKVGEAGLSNNTNPPNFDGQQGTGLSTKLPAGNTSGVNSGSACIPLLTVTKTTTTPSINNQPAGTTATYTITVSNAANRANATSLDIADPLPSGFTYASTTSITLTGGAVRNTTTNPTVGSTNPTWGQFTIPSGGQVQITFVVNVANTVVNGTYQNPATATYLNPQRTTATGTTTATYNSASSTNEDVTVTNNPKLVLVKRMTQINGQNITDIIDGRSDVAVTAANYVDPAFASDDNDVKWLPSYLQGAIRSDGVRPGDRVEYTIYFLSNGDSPVTNVKICDLIPENTTFVATGFNGSSPKDGGLPTADSGIALAIGSAQPTAYMTNVADSDRGEFFSPGTPLPKACSKNTPPIPVPGSQNPNGAVVVNVVTKTTPSTTPAQANEILPYATAAGVPSNSYGFIRFRAKVN